MVAGVFVYKDRDERDDSCRSVKVNYNHNHGVTRWDVWNFLKKQNRDILNSSQMHFPVKGEACLYSRYESPTWG